MKGPAPCRLVFTDTETCGLADTIDEAVELNVGVIEYAFAIWEDGAIKDSFVKQVRPSEEAEPGALHCASQGWNHYDPARWNLVKAARWNADDCEQVDRFLTGETLAGSNPGFDLTMYKAEFLRLGFLNDFPKLGTHRKLDVGQLAWPLWAVGLTERTGLEPLAKLLGVKHDSHTAMGDVLACIKCFEVLIESYVYRPRALTDLLVELGQELKCTKAVEREVAKVCGVAL